MRSFVSRAASFVHAQVDSRDLVLLVGLGLLAAGLYLVFVPAAFIAPGAVLTYVAVWRLPAPQTGSDD